MIAVLYALATGSIAQTMMGSAEAITKTASVMELSVVEVERGTMTQAEIDALDLTHRVVDGALVLKAGAGD